MAGAGRQIVMDGAMRGNGKMALAAGMAAAALLAAGPAPAGGEPLLLLPEVAEEGGAGTAAAPSVPGGDVTPDNVEGAARPERASAPDAPAGGSRLLRALAGQRTGRPAAPGARAEPATIGAAAEPCPRGLLRRLLAGAADEGGALTALAIEQEMLTLCRERQEIVAGLFAAETRLRELRSPATAPAPMAPTALEATPADAAARVAAGPKPARPSPLRAALAAAAETRVPEKANEADPRAADPRRGDIRAGDPRAGDTRAAAPVSRRYAWFSIIGTAGALRAGVTDGSGVWFVREGDALPGGAKVTAIAGRPPGVRIAAPSDGEVSPLPWRALPGGGR